MAIQNRRGTYDKFDPQKMLPGEWASVISGDPHASDGRAVYMCFAAGDVKRMATYEDMVENIREASGDAIDAQIDAAIGGAIQDCQTATNAADTAKKGAESAAQTAANAASAATFTQSSYADAYGLWQWDYGQILRIQGLSLPTAVEIHFSLQSTGGESVTRIGITKDGVTDVLIPDAMLEAETSQNYDIYAFIYLTDEVSGETRHRIRMPVKARPKPSGRTLEEEVGKTTMAAIVEAVNTAIAGKADSMEISGHTLLLKSGETAIATIDIPAVSEEAVQNAVNAYLQDNPMDEYVKFTDLASPNKPGLIMLNAGAEYSGLTIANSQLIINNPGYNSIIGKKNYKSPIGPSQIDLSTVQSTHQEMSDIYDPSTALTPDGNVPYAYGGRQPVSYDAVKRYVDSKKEIVETIFNFTAEEDIVRIDPVEIEPNSYKKIVVIIQTKANASGAFVSTHSYVILNGRDFDMWNVVSSSIGYGIFEIDLYNGYSVLEGKTSRGQSSGAGTNARYISDSISRETMIQTIGFSFATAAFSAGSTIRVTGVRA